MQFLYRFALPSDIILENIFLCNLCDTIRQGVLLRRNHAASERIAECCHHSSTDRVAPLSPLYIFACNK